MDFPEIYSADDNFLEVVEGTDVFALLEQMQECIKFVPLKKKRICVRNEE